MGPLGTMWLGLEQRLGASGGRSPREPAVPFRGSVDPLLGGELIEAVVLPLKNELLSSLGHLGGTYWAELWPGLAVGIAPHPSLPLCYRNRPGSCVIAPSILLGRGHSLPPGDSSLPASKAQKVEKACPLSPRFLEEATPVPFNLEGGGWASEWVVQGPSGPGRPPKYKILFCSLGRATPGVMSQLPSEASSCPSFCVPCVSSQRRLDQADLHSCSYYSYYDTVSTHTRAPIQRALSGEHAHPDPGSHTPWDGSTAWRTPPFVAEETKSRS